MGLIVSAIGTHPTHADNIGMIVLFVIFFGMVLVNVSR